MMSAVAGTRTISDRQHRELPEAHQALSRLALRNASPGMALQGITTAEYNTVRGAHTQGVARAPWLCLRY